MLDLFDELTQVTGTWVVTREGLRHLKLLRRSRQDEADLQALAEEEDDA